MSRTVSPADQTLRILFWILAGAVAAMGVLLSLLPAAGHDQLWFLMMARRWLGGAVLYGPEIFDSNPPGIIWLSSIPVALGNLLHLPASTLGKSLVLLAEAAAGSLSYLLLKRSRRDLPVFLAPALLFAYIVLVLVLPARDFGQRDQMLAFLILPYIIAASFPSETPRLRLLRYVSGLFAAAGICIKPQYALIPVAIELIVLFGAAANLRERLASLLRPEPILIVFAGVVYLLAIHHFTPLYFSVALPVLRQSYWAVGHLSLLQLALEAIELCLLGAASLALYLLNKQRSPLVLALLVAGTAATLAYFIQGTGWYYQQIPGITLFAAALALQLLDLAERRAFTIPRWAIPALASLCILALVLTTHFMGYPFTQDRQFAIETPDPSFFAGLPAGTPITMFTTSVDATMMPVERYHLAWAQRTNNLWLLPAILRSESPSGPGSHRTLPPDQLHSLESLQHQWMVEDFNRWHPQVVLVERCHKTNIHCQLLEERDDDLLGWFLRDPAFVAAWKPYRRVRHAGPFDEYVLSTETR